MNNILIYGKLSGEKNGETLFLFPKKFKKPNFRDKLVVKIKRLSAIKPVNLFGVLFGYHEYQSVYSHYLINGEIVNLEIKDGLYFQTADTVKKMLLKYIYGEFAGVDTITVESSIPINTLNSMSGGGFFVINGIRYIVSDENNLPQLDGEISIAERDFSNKTKFENIKPSVWVNKKSKIKNIVDIPVQFVITPYRTLLFNLLPVANTEIIIYFNIDYYYGFK